MRIDNVSVDPTDIEIRKKIAFVAQDDSLQVTSTPREAIRFSAKLRLPRSLTNEELDIMTNEMLIELGLLKCADTYVGGALLKGISGGERKRTSVGVELVTRPTLIFLDEPTSGLDSYNAVQLCELLGRVCKAGASVLFTIHQPSSEIFNSFDRLILLNQGRVMYQGSVSSVPNYFETRGYPVPPNYNPADWIMKVAVSTSVDELSKVGFFPEDDRGTGDATVIVDKKALKESLWGTGNSSQKTENDSIPPPGFVSQVILLFQREVTNTTRNIHSMRTRTIMTVMISFFCGCLFYQVAKTDFRRFINVQSTFGALFMSLLANVFATALPSLMAFPEERPVFLREYSTNHYSVFSYFISRLAMEMFITGVQVTVSSLITYSMVGYYGNYGIFWSGIYLMACSSNALGIFVGSVVTNPSTAVEFLPAIFLPQILFAGFFVPPELIPDLLCWIRFICPLTYGLRIVVGNEFGHGRCDGINPNFCKEILSQVEIKVNETWWYYLILLVLFVFFRIVALILLKKKASTFY